MTVVSVSPAPRITAIGRLTALRVPPTVALAFVVIAHRNRLVARAGLVHES